MNNRYPNDETQTYVYFSITSNGLIRDGVGFIANEDGIFDPQYITQLLGIQPRKAWKAGDLRNNGTMYGFSSWSTQQSYAGQYDIEKQCLEIVNMLKSKIKLLNKIKNDNDVTFTLMIVPHIWETSPIFAIDSEVIEFCYLTGTRIEVDIYSYHKDE